MKKYLFIFYRGFFIQVAVMILLTMISCGKKENFDTSKQYKEIISVTDSLEKIDFKSVSTLIPDLDLRIGTNEFNRILDNYVKKGALSRIKDSIPSGLYGLSKKDTLITIFEMNVNDTLSIDLEIEYESLLDKIYSISYSCCSDIKNEDEYTLINSFLVNKLRNEHSNLVEVSFPIDTLVKDIFFNNPEFIKGNLSVSLNAWAWKMYEGYGNKKIEIKYEDNHYRKEIESYIDNYLKSNGYIY